MGQDQMKLSVNSEEKIEKDCAAMINKNLSTEIPTQADDLETLIEIVQQLGIDEKVSENNFPLLPWSLVELSERLSHSFWNDLSLSTENFGHSIDEFVLNTPEIEDNYSVYVAYYDQKKNDWEAFDNQWDQLCKDLERPIPKGETAVEQAKFIQLQIQLDELKKQCLTSSSIIIGMRLKLDELNPLIDRLLDQRIKRLLNQQ